MDGALIILFTTLVIYIPLAGILLYVWWKFGKNEKGVSENLSSGDMVNIEPNEKHWVEGIQDTQLLLIK